MRYNFKNTALLAMALAAERIKASMGYVDAQALLSDAQALAATGVSTNTYDTLAATTDLYPGVPLVAEISVDVAADAGNGDETYSFSVISSAAANLGAPTTLNTIAVPRATLVAGYKFYIEIPSKTQRYLGLNYTLGGTTPSITVTASIKPRSMAEILKYYPKNYTIS